MLGNGYEFVVVWKNLLFIDIILLKFYWFLFGIIEIYL